MSNYKLGLCSISFRDKTPEEILSAMKKAGLCCIEWGSDVHAPCGDTDRLHEIVKLQKRYGIECCSYGTYFRLGETPNSRGILTPQRYLAPIFCDSGAEPRARRNTATPKRQNCLISAKMPPKSPQIMG